MARDNKKIRRAPYEFETIEFPREYYEIFLYDFVGIILWPTYDHHVTFSFITEDDEFWTVNYSGSMDHIKKYQDLLTEVDKWCKKNCIATEHGWKFTQDRIDRGQLREVINYE